MPENKLNAVDRKEVPLEDPFAEHKPAGPGTTFQDKPSPLHNRFQNKPLLSNLYASNMLCWGLKVVTSPKTREGGGRRSRLVLPNMN